MEDHGDRAARPGRARRAVRRVQGSRRRGNAEAARSGAPTSRRAAAPIPTASAKAVDMLLAAERPVILVGQGVQVWRRRRPTCCARREAADPGRASASGIGAIDTAASALARSRLARRRLPGQPRGAAGRRAARARRALRRPHVELVDSGLFVHHPADQAHPRRHRSGGDRPQLSGRARADGGRAHLPAPASGRDRRAQGRGRRRRRARNGSTPSTAIARSGKHSSRRALSTTRRRSIRSAPRTRSTRRCPTTPSW